MKGLKDYLLFLVFFVIVSVLGIIGVLVICYLLGCFIVWEWVAISLNDIDITFKDIRILTLAYLFASIVFYGIVKELHDDR